MVCDGAGVWDGRPGHLAGFAHAIVGVGGKDTVESLKAPWMGKPWRKKARKDRTALNEDERERTDRKRTETMRGARVSSQTGAGI